MIRMEKNATLMHKWPYERNKKMHRMVGREMDCSLLKLVKFLCVLYRRKKSQRQKKVYPKLITLLLKTQILALKVSFLWGPTLI